jgi:hypothetical protein
MSDATSINLPRKSFLEWPSTHGLEAFLIGYGLWVFTPFAWSGFVLLLAPSCWMDLRTRSATWLALDRDFVIQMHGWLP